MEKRKIYNYSEKHQRKAYINFKNNLLKLITFGIYNRKNNIQKNIDKLNLEISKYEAEKNTHQTNWNILKTNIEQKINIILETQITILESLESNLIQATEKIEQLNESIWENNIQDEFEIISLSSSKEKITSLESKNITTQSIIQKLTKENQQFKNNIQKLEELEQKFDKNSVNKEVPNNPSLKSRSSSQKIYIV